MIFVFPFFRCFWFFCSFFFSQCKCKSFIFSRCLTPFLDCIFVLGIIFFLLLLISSQFDSLFEHEIIFFLCFRRKSTNQPQRPSDKTKEKFLLQKHWCFGSVQFYCNHSEEFFFALLWIFIFFFFLNHLKCKNHAIFWFWFFNQREKQI